MELITTNAKSIELTGEEVHVHFISAFPYFWIRNDGTETVQMSISPNISEGKDGVIKVLAGSSAGTMHGYNATCNDLYLLGDGKVQVMATYTPENPFKTAGKGGGKNISAAMGYISKGLMCHYSADSEHFTEGWRIDDLSGNDNAGLFFRTNGQVGHFPQYKTNAGNHVFLDNQWIAMPYLNYRNATIEIVCHYGGTIYSDESHLISNLGDTTISFSYSIIRQKQSHDVWGLVRTNGVNRGGTAVTIDDAVVHLFTLTFDDEVIKFYIDGILINTRDLNGVMQPISGAPFTVINGWPYGPVNDNALDIYYIPDMYFYSARVYNRALTDEEVAKNFSIDQSLFFND